MRSHPYTPPPPLPPILHDLATELSTVLPNQQSHLPAADRRPNSAVDLDPDGTPGIPLGDLDPDTSRLLPVRRRRHLVRVQGRVALVRSVSIANLRAYSHRPRGRASCLPARTSKDMPLPAASVIGTRRASSAGTATVGSDRVHRRGPRFESAAGGINAGASRTADRRKRKTQKDGHRYPTRRPGLDSEPGLEGGSGSEAEWECEDDEYAEEDARDMYLRDSQLRGYGIGGWGNIRRPTEVIHFSPRRVGPLGLAPSPPPSPTGRGQGQQDRRKWNLRDIFSLIADRKGKGKPT